MNNFVNLVVFTANILGSFNDPFEFEGNYGEEMNPVREYVFEQVVSKEALVDISSLQDHEQYQIQLSKAIQKDLNHGPTLKQLVTSDLIQLLINKQQELNDNGFSQKDLDNFFDFIDRHQDQKLFSFFRHSPSILLSLDKTLRDAATREGNILNLPILSSAQQLIGDNSAELKANLLEAIFTRDNLRATKPEEQVKISLAHNKELVIFATPAGQAFFYWLYQSLNLHLIAEQESMIARINHVKQIFAETLGNPLMRAHSFKEKLITANASVVFTQESDEITCQHLTDDGLFHSIETQNSLDGTLVFLRSDIWEPNYQVISIEDYQGYAKGRLNVILATKKDSGEKFLLAACHGNSTNAADGRLQITKIKEKHLQFASMPENKGLQLIIGIDANTKSDEEVELLRDELESFGLTATHSGPTTIKKRMVTVQHSKSGHFAVDEEDFIITLKPEVGGNYLMTAPTIGFQEQMPDINITLPNINNLSDHYPVGVLLLK